MTREELKEHCKKEIEMCEFWATGKGEKPSGRIYEEHKMVLELLEQEPCIQEKQANADKIDAVYIDGFKAGYSQARFDLEQETCEDAISRQAAIAAIENEQKKVMRSDWAIDQAKFSAMSEIRELIAELPPVSTEKIGRWIPYCYQNCECSMCGYIISEYDSEKFNFCPNCGDRKKQKVRIKDGYEKET